MELKRRKEIRYASPKYPFAKIGALAEFIQYGISERANTDGAGVPMIRMTNLQPLGWDLSDLKHIELGQAALKKHRLEPGDILFNRTNSKELVGKCEVFNEPGDWVFASYLIRVRLDRSKALPDFVSAFLNTETGRMQIDQVSRQIAGMSNVNAEELKELEIPLPPLSVQGDILRDYAATLAERDHLLQASGVLAKGVDAFVLDDLQISPQGESRAIFAVTRRAVKERLDADYNSPRFEVLRRAIAQSSFRSAHLRDLALSIRSGFAAGSKDQARDGIPSIPHLRPLNLNGYGELTLEGTKSVPRASLPDAELLAPGEVLFNNTNSAEWVGKTAVFDIGTACACSNHMTRIVLGNLIDPYYLAALLNALRGLGYFKALSTYFNNQAGINSATLGELRIPVPPMNVQQRIAEEVKDRKRQARELQEEAGKKWRSARQRFEAKLLNGVG
ncbi:restriction endonuclease subunit S [Tardiphaga sp. 866_E4_N2_1]|uniref:restriction endonuclease subunit S n=1 Tax=unclassified Tardiphaga TaxID=2631404 RepID=UPI003F20D58E